MKTELIPALALSALLALPTAALANEPEQPAAPASESQLTQMSAGDVQEKPGESNDSASAGERQHGSTGTLDQATD